jgi:hypothetical protein
VVEQSVEERRGERGVVGERCRPVGEARFEVRMIEPRS